MKPREKTLLIVFIGCVIVAFAWSQMQSVFREPIDKLQSQIQVLDQQIARHERDERNILSSARKLKSWKQRSLPPDPPTAQRLYQAWLTDLAQDAGLESPKITPGQRLPKGSTFVAVQIALQAQGSLQQITTFLHRFYRAGLLHRIVDLKLNGDLVGRRPTIAVVLTAEGLSLNDAPSRKWLFPHTKLATPISELDDLLHVRDAELVGVDVGSFVQIQDELMRIVDVAGKSWTVKRFVDSDRRKVSYPTGTQIEVLPIDETQLRSRDSVNELLAKNPFVRPVEKVTTTDPPNDTTSELDLAQWTIFTAAITDSGVRQAWIYDRFNNQITQHEEGASLRVADVRASIERINRDHMLLRRDGSTWRLDLGENLRSLKRVD